MEFKIGQVYRFDYESASKSKAKEYANPVKIALTESAKQNLVTDLQTGVDVKEFEFSTKIETLAPYFEAIVERDELIAIRKASDKTRTKTPAEKVADATVADLKAEYFPKTGKAGYYEREHFATDSFYRNYSLDNITLSDTGYVEAVLASKSVTVNGKLAYRFITFNDTTVEQSALDFLDGDEKAKLDFI